MGVIETKSGLINFIVNSSRDIIVSSTIKKVDKVVLGRDIISLNFNNELYLKVDSTISIGKLKFKINYIEEKISDSKTTFILKTCEKLSKTTKFLLPLLGLDPNKIFLNSLFINSFIYFEEGEFSNKIYLWYKFSGEKEFLEFEQSLINLPNFLCVKDVDSTSVYYCLAFEKHLEETLNLIIEGKYSEIHEDYKQTILQFTDVTEKKLISDILYKHEDRRKALEQLLEVEIPANAELCDKFIKSQESFYEEKFKIKETTSQN